MYLKKRKYDTETPDEIIVVDGQSTLNATGNLDPSRGVWVEKIEQAINSTTGSGGSDLHILRKQRRWERNEEWYESQESRKKQDQQIYELHKEKVNEILDKKTEKNRMKRLKKQKAKQLAKKNKGATIHNNDKSSSDSENDFSEPKDQNLEIKTSHIEQSNVELPLTVIPE